MTVVVYIIGLVLVVAGAMFINMGVPIVRLELGWSEIIGGAVAGSAGFVVLALGVVLTRLEGLQRALLGLNMASVLRAPLEEPEPDATWAPRETRPFAPHPLAPAALRPMEPEPEPAAPMLAEQVLAEHDVEPEPPLTDAPLHPEPELPHFAAVDPAEPEPPKTFELDAGAPALAATEDHAPPVPPVEAIVPTVTLDEPEDEEPAPFPAPPSPPPELARGRPNFLAAFLARRNAALERPAPAEESPSVEPPFALPPEPEGRASWKRPSVDLSSGWDPVPPPPEEPEAIVVQPDEEPSVSHAAPVEPEPEHAAHEPPPTEANHEEPLRGSYDEVRAEPVAAAEPEAHEPSEPPPEPDPTMPVVVGRYNAGSATYIMYSSGMIEVETDSGTHRFGSMQELKAFIERRDSARV